MGFTAGTPRTLATGDVSRRRRQLAALRPRCSTFALLSRHAEFPAADLGERGDALAHRVLGRIGEAEPQPALAVGLVRRPFRPRIDGDAGWQARPGQASACRPRPAASPTGRCRPWDPRTRRRSRTARRAIPSASRAWRAGRASARGTWSLKCAAQNSASTICSSAPEPASVLSASMRESTSQRRDDVADPQRRRDRLRERADVDDVAAFRHGVERRRPPAVPDQIRVAIILENRHAVGLATAAAVRRGALLRMIVPVGFCTVGMV